MRTEKEIIISKLFKLLKTYNLQKDSLLNHDCFSGLFDACLYDIEGMFMLDDTDDLEELKEHVKTVEKNIKAIKKLVNAYNDIEFTFG